METTTPSKRRQLPRPTNFASPAGGTRFRPHNGLYSDEIARKICERIMQLHSLTDICKDKKMPSKGTVIRWLADPRLTEFREMYYYARRIQAELRVDEIFEIADNTDNDWTPVYDDDGEIVDHKPNNEAIQRSRVRIDTRKWFAARMMPRIYGEKVEHALDVTGDLAILLKKATNNDRGLPETIEHE